MSADSQTLSLQNKNWVFKPGIPEHINFNLRTYHKVLRQVLYNRGIINEAEANNFLETRSDVFDPFLMKGMAQAVYIIRSAIRDGKKIVIFGDYDADGVTATALLFLFLRECGASVGKYIPNRFEEGYGLTQESLNRLLDMKPDLVITVDCGIRSFFEVDILKREGVEVIISDHHQPLENLPDCLAVICPKQQNDAYPFKGLAGVGIAYKIAKAFMTQYPEFNADADNYLDLVAIGTIADLAPLSDENRILVKRGLSLLGQSMRPGLCALAQVGKVDLKKVNAQDIGFIIAPRLNAAGRMSSADKAFDLLVVSDEKKAREYADELNLENVSRQKEVSDSLKIVKEEGEGIHSSEWLIFYVGSELNEGIIGLVASKLCEEYYRPVVIGSERNGIIRASCRSIPDFNIIKALDLCADLLDHHGGHAMAAGFTLTKDNLDEFVKRLHQISEEQFFGKELQPVIEAEADVSLEDLTTLHMDDLRNLEPTGVENPQPLFVSRNVKMLSRSFIGADNSHVRFKVKAGEGFYSAIAFRMGKIINQLKDNALVDILFAYETNYYNGLETTQLNIKDLRLSQPVLLDRNFLSEND